MTTAYQAVGRRQKTQNLTEDNSSYLEHPNSKTQQPNAAVCVFENETADPWMLLPLA